MPYTIDYENPWVIPKVRLSDMVGDILSSDSAFQFQRQHTQDPTKSCLCFNSHRRSTVPPRSALGGDHVLHHRNCHLTPITFASLCIHRGRLQL